MRPDNTLGASRPVAGQLVPHLRDIALRAGDQTGWAARICDAPATSFRRAGRGLLKGARLPDQNVTVAQPIRIAVRQRDDLRTIPPARDRDPEREIVDRPAGEVDELLHDEKLADRRAVQLVADFELERGLSRRRDLLAE